MQTVNRLLVAVMVAFSLTSACTSPPPRVSESHGAPAANRIGDHSSSPAPSTPGEASNSDVPAPNRPPDAAASQADFDNAMRKRGYKPAFERGQRVYCRNETLTGSNLASQICLTAEQIDNQERAGKDILKSHQAGCLPTKCGCE